MKLLKIIFLFYILGPGICKGQEKVVAVLPAMFNKSSQNIYLSKLDGWIFKLGTDTTWAKPALDISGWQKLKPMDLSAKYADKNGRVECWFRLKIRPDSSFETSSFGIGYLSWAAADLYIDGKPVSSYGNTGLHGGAFEEDHPFGRLPTSIDLQPGREHTIALHLVDYLAPFPPRRLKAEDMNPQFMLSLVTDKYNSYIQAYNIKITRYKTIWVSVSIVLSILFWLLAMLNPRDKNLRLIAACSTFFAFYNICNIGAYDFLRITYFTQSLYNFGQNIFVGLIMVTIPLIVVNIFKRKVTKALRIFLIFLFASIVIAFFVPYTSTVAMVLVLPILILLLVCIYYLVSSWKQLRGAQWTIVAGLISTVTMCLLLFVITSDINPSVLTDSWFVGMTGFMLSFPLSLLVYVAMRFKEIIAEVRQNAQQIVQLSEEKKEEALSRQRVLEEEVNRQTAEIRTTLDNLKATQTQLIQSEKMASLGELTAGIAHEIQNPLNFVNNFSEVNTELIDEMQLEIAKGDLEEIKAIALDIQENEKKINMHGKRADGIVKGMLEHSRSNSGQKEPTDINALADEYLRLSYHGLRAKDKEFNAVMTTSYDPSLPKVNVIPQDIGRVMLNLFNNAFYAVNEKKKKAGPDYKPEIEVTTFYLPLQGVGGLKVRDNGVGIPDAVKEKIMQPFFTTKPTGEGTGLGLSLTYDMVVKGHGGRIEVNSKEGDGSEFIISLPIS
jgi:two-component system NtrC family sensor kinase